MSGQGLLLPLCQSRTCTLREAFIFSAVLRRASIPVLHSAAALLRMAQMEYCGTTSFFIRTLLDKKYALPYRVIDALVGANGSVGECCRGWGRGAWDGWRGGVPGKLSGRLL